MQDLSFISPDLPISFQPSPGLRVCRKIWTGLPRHSFFNRRCGTLTEEKNQYCSKIKHIHCKFEIKSRWLILLEQQLIQIPGTFTPGSFLVHDHTGSRFKVMSYPCSFDLNSVNEIFPSPFRHFQDFAGHVNEFDKGLRVKDLF